ncbi:hypothetical protein COV93_01170 [Candidatus Woesearchaeota archaeon CG11_big_fil_rev_8_21_14_0_20_43_8]|nr:MAG: hypothetical protein COV93_01170 [Candidatus Woesearchaeota archaeon CG11_big_fil_rev_8_21_14_0_20_43_8]
MDIIYLSYGDDVKNHYRTYYSILTFQNNNLSFNGKIKIFTTDEGFYEALPKVDICKFDGIRVQDDIKKYGFFHFFKLDLLRSQKDTFMFVDSDTFFLSDISDLLDNIQPGHAVMFQKEYLLKENPFYRVYLDGIHHLIQPDTVMYNSGVIGIHKKDIPLIGDALPITRNILDKKKVHTAEQLALSAVLQKRLKITEACRHMIHYWNRKDYYDPKIKKIVDQHKQQDNRENNIEKEKNK